MISVRLFLRLSRLPFLVGVALVYALGVGIAHYLGHRIDWQVYLWGQLWVSLLQLSAQYLNEYYDAPADADNPNRTMLTGGSGAIGEGKLPARVALLAGFTCLAFLASLTVILISRVQPAPEAYFIMVIAFLGAFFYSTPPVRLEASGFGELTASVLVALLTPAYAFVLQAGSLHRLIAMSTFPLFLIHLAMLLALELPDYSTDLKHGKRTMMVRLGWQSGMFIHNAVILSAFLLLLVAASLGYPRFAAWAGFLALPVGLFQIWQMRNIANGGKPNWKVLTLGAVGLFAGMTYLMAFSFWMN